ncbi:MAG: hypothetical protein VB016_06275 [Methanomassiliicoccaceae archaeon]|nr:hypothetical protein [Methanomassiliicoccaceae archaeon]
MIPSVFSSCAFVFFITALIGSKAAFDGFAASYPFGGHGPGHTRNADP